ncbi:hypothetical protein [Streptomyces altiplanensis]
MGEDHPRTLTARNNLATAYASAGDLGRAIPLYMHVAARYDGRAQEGTGPPHCRSCRWRPVRCPHCRAGQLLRRIRQSEETSLP